MRPWGVSMSFSRIRFLHFGMWLMPSFDLSYLSLCKNCAHPSMKPCSVRSEYKIIYAFGNTVMSLSTGCSGAALSSLGFASASARDIIAHGVAFNRSILSRFHRFSSLR